MVLFMSDMDIKPWKIMQFVFYVYKKTPFLCMLLRRNTHDIDVSTTASVTS